MRNKLFFLLVLSALVMGSLGGGSGAYAHILNEKTQFADIASSPYAADIVYLTALNIIPQTPTFEPEAPLTMKDLAAWLALFHRLGQGGETPDDLKVLQEKALQEGLVPSLQGNGTWQGVATYFFAGKVSLEGQNPEAVPQKGEAAAFIAAHMDGAMLKELGAEPGPTGQVEAVHGEEGHGDHHGSYLMVIGGQEYPLDPHTRVVGPQDLTQWEGLYVVRSLMAAEGSEAHHGVFFLQAGEPPAAEGEAPASPAPGQDQPETEEPPASSSASIWLLGLGGGAVVLALILFAGRRMR
ncbi:MAG: hypothetical protein QJR00_07890 [Bacillota bacterium]|nr:hypothetical protein [Bacillota bacterium]